MTMRSRIAGGVLLGMAAPAAALAMLIGDGARSASSSGAAAVEGLGNRELAGLRVGVGFSGTSVPSWLERAIRRGDVGAVVLFSENVSSSDQVRALTRDLQRIERPDGVSGPLLVMTDQEGGAVKRIPGPPTMSAQEMGRAGARTARKQGRATGRNLDGVGVNVDLAPVMDVARRGSAMAREGRSFGRRPGKVARLAGGFFHNLQRAGVAATGKHFPGFGAAGANTDVEAVRIDVSKRKLRRKDERPFKAAFRRGLRLVMLSMAIYPALDSERPASLSKSIASRELRRRLGFDGVSVTDALDTPTAQQYGSPAKLAKRGAKAGVDILLWVDGRAGLAGSRALRRGLRSGKLARGRFEESARRVLELGDWLAAR